jgi:hypothetical protein
MEAEMNPVFNYVRRLHTLLITGTSLIHMELFR